MEGTTYYVEGTDCVGKDTMGLYIADTMGVSNIQKLSLHENNPWDNDRTKELPSDHPLIPAYLVRSVIWDILHYKPTEDQVQISLTAPRSAAWQLTEGGSFADIFTDLVRYSPPFAHPILLHASIEAKRERLLQREIGEGRPGSVIDKLAFTNPEFVQQMDENLKLLTVGIMGAIIIDTSKRSVEEVQAIIMETIKAQQKSHEWKVGKIHIEPELARFYQELVRFSRGVALKEGLPETVIEKVILPFSEDFREI